MLILFIITILSNALSIMGSFFICICYLLFSEIKSFAFKLVFFLAIADFLLGLSRLINFEF